MKITPLDIEHREFKKALQGYAREDVDQFLDEIIASMEEDIETRTALESKVADLEQRVSHFRAMEESLQSTLVLAQRTADELKAAAHKEVELIKQRANLDLDNELQAIRRQIEGARSELQRVLDHLESVKHDFRTFLTRHLALVDESRPSLNAAGSANEHAS
ncbi:MAG TPA: DivIVA domain-containing protein [Candidatus Eremiobacteraceae bacterium]|nr:DivIVA domain-containing protein [Candidatus Eremiobacteraceae bacterium]